MAHLNENYQIIGKLKDLIFRVVNGKVVVQSRPNYRQVKQSKGTKKAALDFGRASITTKKLNAGWQEMVQGYHSSDMFIRLRSKVLRATRTRNEQPLGQKELWYGAPEALEGFEFNRESQYRDLSELWVLNWQVDGERRLHFHQKSFIPKQHLYWLPFTGRLEICYWLCAYQKKDYKPCGQQLIKLEVFPENTPFLSQNVVSEPFPIDCLLTVTVGLLYYKRDPTHGELLQNHKHFHPVRLLKVFKL